MSITQLPVQRRRRNAKVPLRVGDVWVYIGPATEVTIVGLEPRPTFQKPDSQAVTLDDGRTITEATLRSAYQRLEEYKYTPSCGDCSTPPWESCACSGRLAA